MLTFLCATEFHTRYRGKEFVKRGMLFIAITVTVTKIMKPL
jgi:hypothetical protein